MHRSIASTLMVVPAVAAMLGVVAPGVASAAPSDIAVTNGNLKGAWTTVPAPFGFRIVYENPATGFCKGRSDLGTQYTMSHCRVTGQSYKITLTFNNYRLWYSGVITGNTTSGTIHDSIGAIGQYTGTRP